MWVYFKTFIIIYLSKLVEVGAVRCATVAERNENGNWSAFNFDEWSFIWKVFNQPV